MQSKEKIYRAAWQHFQGARDVVVKNVLSAIHNENVKVDQSAVQSLLNIITSSIDEGYHRGYSVFEREISTALNELNQDQDVVLPLVNKSLKKK